MSSSIHQLNFDDQSSPAPNSHHKDPSTRPRAQRAQSQDEYRSSPSAPNHTQNGQKPRRHHTYAAGSPTPPASASQFAPMDHPASTAEEDKSDVLVEGPAAMDTSDDADFYVDADAGELELELDPSKSDAKGADDSRLAVQHSDGGTGGTSYLGRPTMAERTNTGVSTVAAEHGHEHEIGRGGDDGQGQGRNIHVDGQHGDEPQSGQRYYPAEWEYGFRKLHHDDSNFEHWEFEPLDSASGDRHPGRPNEYHSSITPGAIRTPSSNAHDYARLPEFDSSYRRVEGAGSAAATTGHTESSGAAWNPFAGNLARAANHAVLSSSSTTTSPGFPSAQTDTSASDHHTGATYGNVSSERYATSSSHPSFPSPYSQQPQRSQHLEQPGQRVRMPSAEAPPVPMPSARTQSMQMPSVQTETAPTASLQSHEAQERPYRRRPQGWPSAPSSEPHNTDFDGNTTTAASATTAADTKPHTRPHAQTSSVQTPSLQAQSLGQRVPNKPQASVPHPTGRSDGTGTTKTSNTTTQAMSKPTQSSAQIPIKPSNASSLKPTTGHPTSANTTKTSSQSTASPKSNAQSTSSTKPTASASQPQHTPTTKPTTTGPSSTKPSSTKPSTTKPTAPTSPPTPTRPDIHPNPNPSTHHTQYVNMLLALDTIPRTHNLAASFFTWILLAGFVLFPGTFESLQTNGDGGNGTGGGGVGGEVGRRVLGVVGSIPIFVLGWVCCAIGAVGMIWLWWRWTKNYVWVVNKLFIPGTLNSLAGLLSTLSSLYGTHSGLFSTSSIITLSVTASSSVIFSILTGIWTFWLVGRVKRRHDVEVGKERSGKRGEGVVDEGWKGRRKGAGARGMVV